MKTIKLKRVITLSSILLIMLFSNPMFSQLGLPEDDYNVDDQVAAPIDQDIWLGLIGGCLISVYLMSRKLKDSYNN